ncbi:MAG: hypothetical protein IKH12_04035 [Clostridia bacterium]|nr:hypothetical protein [Clostridia bacterium]
MKPTDLTDALNGVDPAFIKESEPEAASGTQGRYKPWARIAALAAALAVLISAGTVAARHGFRKPTAQDETGLQALLRPLTACAAEYPAQTPYPAEGELAPQSELEAWTKADLERRQKYYGAGKSLAAYFARSLPAFLEGSAGQNSVCSPLNIYFALAMLAEISGGETRAQVLSLLGAPDLKAMRTQANRVFNANYRNDGSAACILADSLWLNENVTFNRNTLKTLAEQYYASTYRGKPGTEDFDKAIRAWVNSQTGGLLQDVVSGIATDELTSLALYTTAYFGDKWQAEFSADETKQDVFHGPDGDAEAAFMHATDLWGEYYWGQHFGAVKKDLQQHGAVWFVLPDEGTSLEDLLRDEEALRFLFTGNKYADWQNKKSLRVNLSLPKFDVSSQLSLREGLQKLGVTDCFNEKADFSPLTDDKPVAVSEINHGARVIADEKGVTAAAYTEMLLAGAAMPPEDEMDFTLDRPFLFAVMSDDYMPLFVGVVNQP